MSKEIKRRSRCWMSGLTIMALGIFSGSVHAQDPQSVPKQAPRNDAAPRLEEIVVTAQRREQALTDVSRSVQALQGSDLEAAGVTNLIEIIQMIPGASSPAQISAGTEVYQIRGVAAGQAIGDSTVGFYLDEFAFNIPGLPYAPSVNIYDVERVEVVRGPSGTLYGQGSLGGTIKVVSKAPNLNELVGSMYLSAASTSEGSPNGTASAMLNIPLVENTLAVRGVLTFDRDGGYVDLPNLQSENVNDKTETFGRAKLLFHPTDRLDLTLGYWRNKIEQGYTNRIDNVDPPLANDVGPGESPMHYSLYTVDAEYDLEFATLLSASGWLDQKVSLLAIGSNPTFGAYDISTDTLVNSFSQELRLTSNGDNFVNWIVGGFYQKSDQTLDRSYQISIPGFIERAENTIRSQAFAVYGEASLSLLDGALIPTLGGRWFSDKRELEERSVVNFFGPPPSQTGPTIESYDGTNEAFSPRINIALHPSEEGMYYVEISKGFRSGAIQGESAVAVLKSIGVIGSTSLGPDTLWSYEVGGKWTLFDRSLRLEVAAYQYDWNEAQLQFSPAGLTALITAGDVRGRGLDVSVNWRTPLDGLSLLLSGNINETELRDVPSPVSAKLPWLSNDHQLPGTPQASAMAALNYEYQINAEYHATLDATYSYRDKQQDIVSGRVSEDLNMLSIRAGGGNERFEAQIFVENLSDERGPSAIAGGRFIIPYPRQIGATLQVHF